MSAVRRTAVLAFLYTSFKPRSDGSGDPELMVGVPGATLLSAALCGGTQYSNAFRSARTTNFRFVITPAIRQ